MNKIDIPQVVVSYANGTGGEWLAYQIGQHKKYYDCHDGELEGWKNEYNRWRITPSWRMHMLDESQWKETWLEEDYDGTDEWWDNKKLLENNTHKESYYQEVRELVESKRRYRIPVHRVHEAWQDVYWKDLFEDFKVVTIHLNRQDYTAMAVMQSNVVRKIWWQEFRSLEDLNDELIDKCRKHKVDYDMVMSLINKFSGYTNYTDMMLAINMVLHAERPEEAVGTIYDQIAERWNDYNIEQHSHKLPCDHLIVDYGALFVNRDYNEYLKLCDFLGMDPWTKEDWDNTLMDYINEDVGAEEMIFIEQLKERLWMRVAEAYEYE